MCDLKIENISLGERDAFKADISLVVDRKTNNSQIGAIGDLRTLYGFDTVNGKGMHLKRGKCFTVSSDTTLDDDSYLELLKDGITHFIDDGKKLTVATRLPVNIVSKDNVNNPVLPGDPAFFNVQDSIGLVAVVLEGQWISLR